MAFVVTTDAATGVGETSATLNGHWTGATEDEFGWSVDYRFRNGYNGEPVNVSGAGTDATENGTKSSEISGLGRDRTVTFRFECRDQDGAYVNGSNLSFKTLAADAVFASPIVVTALGDTWATIRCAFWPNTMESTATLTLQSRLWTSGGTETWVDGNSSYGWNGSSQVDPSLGIAGLLANTRYEVRFKSVRDTQNATTAFSSPIDFTTAAEPAGGCRICWFG